MMRLFRAWMTLLWLSFKRLLWSSSTFMVLFPLVGAGMFLLRYRRRLALDDSDVFEFAQSFVQFSNVFVVTLFAMFLLPVVALAFATSSIGGDREDRTLLFLLVRPVPKALVLLAKFCATLPLVLGLTIGSFYIYCNLAGDLGKEAWRLYLQPLVLMSLAYVCLFHLFAVLFRHATIGALIYALFMELMLGNMPGIIKRVAISFYGRSIIYANAQGWGLEEPPVFEPLRAETATWMLLIISGGAFALAAFVFQRREYRDLT